MKLATIGTKGLSSLERRPQLIESVDESMIGLMRLILASSALLIIYIDPAEPDHFVRATYAALVLYVVYSLILYLTSLTRRPALQWRFYWAHWVDVLWFTVFISLSSGTNSVFFFFYYFSILIASFRWGFGSGVLVTIVSSVLFTVMGYLFGPSNVDLNRSLLRPLSLLVLGYMIAYWGGFEIELRRRLKFLKEITRLSNPRFGVDRTINWAMEQFRSFYNADSCLLILSNRSADYHSLRRIDRVPENCTTSAEALGPEVAKLFLSFPPGEAVIYKRYARGYLLNIQTGETSKIKSSNVLVANLLESRAFLSVPVNYRGETIGRLYIVGERTQFVLSDVDFVLQAIDQVIPVIDNIRLVDHLASDAAERERERIARDIAGLSNRHKELTDRLKGVQFRWSSLILWALASSLGFALLSYVGGKLTEEHLDWRFVLGFGVIGMVGGVSVYGRLLTENRDSIRQEALIIERQLGVKQLSTTPPEDFFSRLVSINFTYIDQYYLQTKEQADKSFRLSAAVATVGFLTVIAGITLMYRGLTQPAYVTAASGVLTEFISGVFFYLYNRTILKMSEYHKKLVLTQNICFALKISEGLEQAEESQALMQLMNRLTDDVNYLLAAENPRRSKSTASSEPAK